MTEEKELSEAEPKEAVETKRVKPKTNKQQNVDKQQGEPLERVVETANGTLTWTMA